MNNLGLAEATQDAIASMCDRAGEFLETDVANAQCIINEWTTETNACVLTAYLDQRLTYIDDIMLFCSVQNDELLQGTFSFDPDAQLIDND